MLRVRRRQTAFRKRTFVQKHGAGHATRKSGRTRSFPSAVACRRVGHPRSWQPTETPPPTFDAQLRGAYAQDVPFPAVPAFSPDVRSAPRRAPSLLPEPGCQHLPESRMPNSVWQRMCTGHGYQRLNLRFPLCLSSNDCAVEEGDDQAKVRHRFPPVIIQHAFWLYFRFALSFVATFRHRYPAGFGAARTRTAPLPSRRINAASTEPRSLG